MRHFIHKCSTVFLLLVGIEYVLLAIIGFFISLSAVGLLSAPFTIIIPHPNTLLRTLTDAYCANPGSVECSHAVMTVSRFVSFIVFVVGVVGILGAIKMDREKKIGYLIWAFLLVLFLTIILGNWYWAEVSPASPSLSMALYLIAYAVAKKTSSPVS